MAKKNTQPEKELHAPFELSDVSRETAKVYAEHLANMVLSQGWLLMEQILKGNCARIERIIITRMEPETHAKLSEAELDEYRIQLNQIERLIQHPHDLIKQYKAVEEPVTKTYDPYAASTDRRELQRSEVVRTLTDE